MDNLELPERLRSKVLYCLVPLHDKAHGGELTGAVADEFVTQRVGELLLESHRLKPGEGGANSQVKLLSAVNCSRYVLINLAKK